MKFAVSYFYQIRFFKPNMIPVSTAVSDPKWFHQNKGNNFTYFDKNGVINGLRYEGLAPGQVCQGLCHGPEGCAATPPDCTFLKAYRSQLEISVNLEDFLARCERAAQATQSAIGYEEEPVIVLIVHEATDNPCSERASIIDYFTAHGIEIDELKYPIA